MAENVRVVDPLYESYCLPLNGLIEHRFLLRAKGVGLSAIPPQWVRGQYFDQKCDPSRFEHSCGVARLALGICVKNQIQTLDFIVAAFLHDISQPAFAHLGEQRLPGYNARERAAQMVMDDSLAAVIRKAGANPVIVAAAIRGKGPYGALLSGPLDIDHIDSTLRYTMRYGILQKHVYHALEIAKAYQRSPRGDWVLNAGIVPQLERWRLVMERNCQVAYGKRFLGRVALLQKALDAYQAERGDIAKLLSGTDWGTAERLRRTPSAAMYIKMLDENGATYHLGDVPAPGVAPDLLCRRAAAQVGLPEHCVLAEGPRTGRTETMSLPLSDGRTFKAQAVVPAILRVYSIQAPPRPPDPAAWLAPRGPPRERT